jgi:UDP-glucose 4-epimerase
MKLLVTGGAGYIGSVMTAQLLAAGHEVTVFDNLSKGHIQAVPAEAHFIEGDLLNEESLNSVLTMGFDGVLHFAALSLVGESVQQPERYYRNNVCGTLNLLEAMHAAHVPRLVFSSTAAVYGAPEEIPILETAVPRPTNPYGGSKLAIDQMIGFVVAAHGLAAVSLRYFNVAGASGQLGEDHHPETHLIPLVLAVAAGQRSEVQIYGTDYPTPDGTAIRDYIHVEDLARAHLLALESVRAGEHRIYNLGNGMGFSVREVIETARQVTGVPINATPAPRRAGDPPILVASSQKIREELGWIPHKPDLATMIGDAWKWRQAHLYGYDH